MTDPRRLSVRELEDIIEYEADFTGATYKPTTTFLMAHEIVALRAENARLREEIEESDDLVSQLSQMLERTVNIVKGEPPPLTRWGWHGLPELVQQLKDSAALQEGSDDSTTD